MKVNRWLDLLDRVGWTAVQAFVGYLVANVALGDGVDWKKVFVAALFASLIAAGKVVLAQNVGTTGLGDAVPGGVVEKTRKKK